jgi:peptide/nickel transport system permease protein
VRYADSEVLVGAGPEGPVVVLDAPMRGKAWRNIATLLLGSSIILLMIALAVVIPLVSPFGTNDQDLVARLKPPGWTNEDGLTHWLGTDSLGRDVLVRVAVGARLSLFISFTSVVAMFMLGTVLGLVAGFMGRRADGFIMRVVDVQMAFPVVLAAIALVALIGPSFWSIVLVFMVTGWPVFARTTRASTLALKEVEFVEAAQALGAGKVRLMLREILPNLMGPLLVLASYQIAEVILFESSLSFLGLGIQPPTPSWGGMMAEGRDYLDTSWWVSFFPGVALLITAAGANRLGNSYSKVIASRR